MGERPVRYCDKCKSENDIIRYIVTNEDDSVEWIIDLCDRHVESIDKILAQGTSTQKRKRTRFHVTDPKLLGLDT